MHTVKGKNKMLSDKLCNLLLEEKKKSNFIKANQ